MEEILEHTYIDTDKPEALKYNFWDNGLEG